MTDLASPHRRAFSTADGELSPIEELGEIRLARVVLEDGTGAFPVTVRCDSATTAFALKEETLKRTGKRDAAQARQQASIDSQCQH